MSLKEVSGKNPVWIAASHLTENLESIHQCCQEGAGGIVLKGTDGRLLQQCNRNCQECQFPHSFHGRRLFIKKPTLWSFTPNSFLCEFLSLEEIKSLLNFLKTNYPQVLRIANISGRNSAVFIRTARRLQKFGVQILELNTKYTIKYRDAGVSGDRKYLLSFIKKIIKEIRLPLLVKIFPDTDLLEEGFLKDLSKYVDGVTIADAKRIPLPSVFKKRLPKGIQKNTCAVVGETLWELVRKYVPIAKNYFGFVSASGGIYNPQRAKEIMKLGADSVQLCSGIEFFGYNLIRRMVKEIKSK